MVGGGLSNSTRFFTLEEVSQITGNSIIKINEDLSTGKLKFFKMHDNTFNILGSHLNSHIKKNMNLNNESEIKICSRCNVAKESSCFHACAGGQYGVHAICKKCRKDKYVEKVKKNKEYCVYRFIDCNDNIVYIGLTDDINRRMQYYKIGKNKDIVFEDIKLIEYQKFESRIDMVIRELYYINKYKPIYNKRDKEKSKMETELVEIPWFKYISFGGQL